MNDLLHVYYDTRYAPVTYDFATYLVTADAVRFFNNFKKIFIHIHSPDYRNLTEREIAYTNVEKKWRSNNIFKGVTSVLPNIDGIEYSNLKPDNILSPYFPDTYPPKDDKTFGSIPYLYTALSTFRNLDYDLKPYRADELSIYYVKNIFEDKVPDFTITLRSSNQQIARNSNLAIWHEIYINLTNKGFRVVVIPDLEDITSNKMASKYDWDLFLPAVFDMQIRMALYSITKNNFCVLNGVIVPLIHSPYPYTVFKPLVNGINQTTEKWLFEVFGIKKNENFWWSSNNQNLLWLSDDENNFKDEILNIALKS